MNALWKQVLIAYPYTHPKSELFIQQTRETQSPVFEQRMIGESRARIVEWDSGHLADSVWLEA